MESMDDFRPPDALRTKPKVDLPNPLIPAELTLEQYEEIKRLASLDLSYDSADAPDTSAVAELEVGPDVPVSAEEWEEWGTYLKVVTQDFSSAWRYAPPPTASVRAVRHALRGEHVHPFEAGPRDGTRALFLKPNEEDPNEFREFVLVHTYRGTDTFEVDGYEAGCTTLRDLVRFAVTRYPPGACVWDAHRAEARRDGDDAFDVLQDYNEVDVHIGLWILSWAPTDFRAAHRGRHIPTPEDIAVDLRRPLDTPLEDMGFVVERKIMGDPYEKKLSWHVWLEFLVDEPWGGVAPRSPASHRLRKCEQVTKMCKAAPVLDFLRRPYDASQDLPGALHLSRDQFIALLRGIFADRPFTEDELYGQEHPADVARGATPRHVPPPPCTRVPEARLWEVVDACFAFCDRETVRLGAAPEVADVRRRFWPVYIDGNGRISPEGIVLCYEHGVMPTNLDADFHTTYGLLLDEV